MSEPYVNDEVESLAPVHEHDGEPSVGRWTRRLVFFLRTMAVVSMLKGLYHWARVCGIGGGDKAESGGEYPGDVCRASAARLPFPDGERSSTAE